MAGRPSESVTVVNPVSMEAAGGSAGILLIALLFGLRHATDPDHLTAVSTLVLGDRRSTPGRAGWLGLCWGAGHAATVLVLGLPLIALDIALPGTATRLAEFAIGVLIAALAARLLLRWSRGYFHWHAHRHGGVLHSHPHFHEHEAAHATVGPRMRGARSAGHGHSHPQPPSPAASFGVGLVHGIGGSAGAGVLIVTAIPGRAGSFMALLLFSLGTAVSMGATAYAFGWILSRERVMRTMPRLLPGLATVSLAFGVWYAVQAAGIGAH